MSQQVYSCQKQEGSFQREVVGRVTSNGGITLSFGTLNAGCKPAELADTSWLATRLRAKLAPEQVVGGDTNNGGNS